MKEAGARGDRPGLTRERHNITQITPEQKPRQAVYRLPLSLWSPAWVWTVCRAVGSVSKRNPARHRGLHMKLVVSVVAIAMLAVASLPAQAAQEPIYRASGVRDSGGAAGVGVATAIHCTNFDTTAATVRVRIRNFNGQVVGDSSVNIASRNTNTFVTHDTLLFFDNTNLSAGTVIDQGSLIVTSNSLEVICSAMIVDAASSAPQGIALHLVRSNPLPGTEE